MDRDGTGPESRIRRCKFHQRRSRAAWWVSSWRKKTGEACGRSGRLRRQAGASQVRAAWQCIRQSQRTRVPGLLRAHDMDRRQRKSAVPQTMGGTPAFSPFPPVPSTMRPPARSGSLARPRKNPRPATRLRQRPSQQTEGHCRRASRAATSSAPQRLHTRPPAYPTPAPHPHNRTAKAPGNASHPHRRKIRNAAQPNCKSLSAGKSENDVRDIGPPARRPGHSVPTSPPARMRTQESTPGRAPARHFARVIPLHRRAGSSGNGSG